MLKRFLHPTLALGLALVFTTAHLPALEPDNLYTLKQQINGYVSSGEYGKAITTVAMDANKYLLKRIPRGVKGNKKMAVVFDIDETTLSNLGHIQANDYGYIPKVWDAWVAEGKAKAIFPMQTVYDTAVRNKVDVFFITGRKVSDAPGTEKNLREVGYDTWTRIIYKPDDFKESARAFKIDMRRKLTAEGYVIILNVGDQNSDLVGGYAEKFFKLPNPFYIAN